MNDLKSYFYNNWFPFFENKKCIIATSGGVDSMVLLFLFHHFNLKIKAVHCNYHLRGQDSIDDQTLVESFCKTNHIELESISFKNQIQAPGIQEKARNLRYTWFNQLLEIHNFDTIVLAHHNDDQLETIIHHMLRGTGIKGFGAMDAIMGPHIRPLLQVSKYDIEQCALQNAIPYRHDQSNFKTDYKRNKIRHDILPKFNEINANSKEHVLNLSEIVNQSYDNLKFVLINDKQLCEFKNNELIKINISRILTYPHPSQILYSLLENYAFNINQIMNMIENKYAQPGLLWESNNYQLILDRGYWLIKKNNTELFEYKINALDDNIETPFGKMIISENQIPIDGKNRIVINKDILKDCLICNWNKGDKIKPFGMKGSQKISDILINEKVSLVQKSKTLVLKHKNNIIWLIGHRFSEDYKLKNYNNCYYIQWIPND